MSSEVFVKFLRAWDSKLRAESRHVTVLLHHCSARPATLSSLLTNIIKLLLLPAYPASKLDPLDNGIVRTLKVHYQRKIVQHTFHLEDINLNRLATIDILKAIYYIAAS